MGVAVSAAGFSLAVGSWAHNWLGIIGSPRFGPIDLAIRIIGIIMMIGIVYRQKIKLE